jgi:hypothetical protein
MSKNSTKEWDALLTRLRQQFVLRVGIVGEQAKVDRGGLTQAELGAVHEFGSPTAGIPRRSFLKEGVETAEFHAQAVKKFGQVAKAIVSQKVTAEQGLDALGLWAAAQLKIRITKGLTPANSPTVEARKKGIGDRQTANSRSRNKAPVPLVDTGSLLNAITHVIVKKGQ